MKRLQVAAMAMLVALGFWLVLRPALTRPKIPATPGALVMEVRAGGRKITFERVEHAGAPETYRFLTSAADLPAEPLQAEKFWGVFNGIGRGVAERPPLFRALNVSTWWAVAWVVVGFTGQLAFMGRILVQWVVSEREKRSVVPAAFWWLSLGGGVMLFAYFAWRQDPVGVMGQAPGMVIYTRNLVLIRRQRGSGSISAENARDLDLEEAALREEAPNPQAV